MDRSSENNERLERSKLEDLPVEMIHHIFDYLSGDQVIDSFLHLNNRFDEIISGKSLNTIDLTKCSPRKIIDWMKKSFEYLTKSGISFLLSNRLQAEDHSSAKIEFVFSLLVDEGHLNCYWTNLQQIILVRPIIDSSICLPDVFLRSYLIYSSAEKILLKKNISSRPISSLMISSVVIIRSLLDNYGGLQNQLFVHYKNSQINSLIRRVQHLKFHIDDYDQQWPLLSPFIIKSLAEFTLIIDDSRFEFYHGLVFSSLVSNLSNHCPLHFFLQFEKKNNDIDGLMQSFQSDFYREHQCQVTIVHDRYFSSHGSMLIYTSPLCVSQLMLPESQRTAGENTIYTNLTRLTFDPCHRDYARMNPLMNPGVLLLANFVHLPQLQNVPNLADLPRLNSLEFISTSRYPIGLRIPSTNEIFSIVAPQIHHLHLNRYRLSPLLEEFLPGNSFNHLHFLDITGDTFGLSSLSNLSLQPRISSNILHLKIFGCSRLTEADIKLISQRFTNLQTLRFSLKFHSPFINQLDAIGNFLLISMRNHLRYLHIDFEQDNLLIMSMNPSEHQLGEWLGYNQRRFAHIQAIELNRKQLAAWM